MMRIFLAESDPELRVGLQFLINQQPGIQVIGIADNGNDLPSQLVASRPDVIVLDWKLPGKPIVELLADIQTIDLPLKIIAISTYPQDEFEAKVAGVDIFATKTNTPKKLIELLGTMKSEISTTPQALPKESDNVKKRLYI